MTNRSGYGMAIALPFFVLWLTQDNIAYLCIAIALGFSLGRSDCKKEQKK
ncbi:hypothetical protein [Planomicrobium sp. CPCC 101079]|nr:hypothetical protein [Planomicrobium sp. CPCC 101079]